jgi:hypothetical protein
MRFSTSRQLYAIWRYNNKPFVLQTGKSKKKENGNLIIGSILEIKIDNMKSKFLTIPYLKFFTRQFKICLLRKDPHCCQTSGSLKSQGTRV